MVDSPQDPKRKSDKPIRDDNGSVSLRAGYSLSGPDLVASIGVDGLSGQLPDQPLDPHSIARLSHDLRAPLMGLMGYMELLEETGLSEQQADLLSHAVESANGLLAMINDVLDVSRLEAGRMPLGSAPFRLRECCGQLMAQLAPLAFRKRLMLTLIVEPQVPDCLAGDAIRFGQIVTNLVGNAIKFTRQGEVRLRVGLRRKQDSSVRLFLDVSDTGIGIDDAKQSALFEPFVQGESAFNTAAGGSGLGLEICRRLVAMMQGSIRVMSTPGTGSCFQVELELASASQAIEVAAAPDLSGCSVLLAIEHAGLREELSALIDWAGGRVILLDSGQASLDSALSQAPVGSHVLLVDGSADGAISNGQREICQQATALGHRSIVVLPSLQSSVMQALARRMACDVVSTRARPAHLLGKLQCRRTIPPQVHPDAQIQEPSPTDAADSSLHGLRVLVVDDDELVGMLMERILGKQGAVVALAASMSECLERLSRSCFDVVILDFNLPDAGGCDAVERIRERQSPDQPIQVIGLSAEAATHARPRALEAGMDAYLEKPVTAAQLVACLSDVGQASA